MNPESIVVKHIRYHYGDIEAVKDISFEVEKGEIFGFLGPNGRGHGHRSCIHHRFHLKDMMGVTAWGTMSFLIFTIPALSIMLGGAFSGWIKLIPTYYVMNPVMNMTQYGYGWEVIRRDTLLLIIIDVCMVIVTGVIARRTRQMET